MNWNDYYFPNEMLEQADAIENCMNALVPQIKDIAKTCKNANKVHIVGSGDCYFIGFAVAHAFKKYARIEAIGYEAYDYFLLKPEVDENTMVVLFSSSGKSLYVMKSLEYVSECKGIAVGVTNHEDSPLGTGCTIPLITVATGVSRSFPTKTSTSAIALMLALAVNLGLQNNIISEDEARGHLKELQEIVPATIRKIYETEHPKLKQSAQMFLEARCYYFVGSGPSRSASMIGGAKIMETNHCHSVSTNAEEYMHLNGFSIKSSDVVVVMGNNISNHRENQVVEYANDQCARVLVIGDVESPKSDNIVKVAPFIKELSPYAAVIANMVVCHLFACELSRLSFKDPDKPHDVDLKKVIDLLYTGPVAGWQV